MKLRRLLAAIILLSTVAFAGGEKTALELDVGFSSPNKGLVGLRFSPMPTWFFGAIWGSMSNYIDVGITGSYHFWGYSGPDLGYTGPYVYQSHHLLFYEKDSKGGSIWEVNTGGGYQYHLRGKFLAYAEVGVPFYIGGGKVYRYYEGGRARNRTTERDLVVFDVRAGLGLGYIFEFDY